MDTVINAVILTSGATVFAGSNFSWLLGGIVAVLSGCNIAWKFGRRAQAAKEQAHRYNVLITESDGLSTEVLLARLVEIEKQDSPVLECMDNPARNKACAALLVLIIANLSHSPKKSLPALRLALPAKRDACVIRRALAFWSVVRVHDVIHRAFMRRRSSLCISPGELVARLAQSRHKVVDFAHDEIAQNGNVMRASLPGLGALVVYLLVIV